MMRRLNAFFLSLFVAVSATASLLTAGAAAAESQDVSFYTPAFPREPEAKQFYYNGRAFGVGPESFAAIIDQIAKLPVGTSVVWGANYGRCGSCAIEPKTLPQVVYPDLWERLNATAQKHQLRLSSAYPGPQPSLVGREQFTALPAPVAPESLSSDRSFDATLDWKISEIVEKRDDAASDKSPTTLFGDRYSANDKELSGFELELFLGRLPENSRVLVRIVWAGDTEEPKTEPRLRSWANHVGKQYRKSLADPLGQGKLVAKVTAPEALRGALATADEREGLTIDWSNFRSPETRHDEVLYLANGRFVGRGDEGFERLLSQFRKLPPYAEVILPRYGLWGRVVADSMPKAELTAKNEALRDVVPFADRRSEFDALVAEKNLAVSHSWYAPPWIASANPPWGSGGSGFRPVDAYASEGRIIHHDEKPSTDAVRISWVNMASDGKRPKETQAIITYNDQLLGADFVGFGRVMQKIWKLPKGSVVQVSVCLRTEGPFTCPEVYAGQRHFEVTGSEPYAAFIPWLIDAARKRDLTIEWIPDEKVSARNCSLSH